MKAECVDSKDAPEGYMAVAYVAGNSSCGKCSFSSSNGCRFRAAGVSCLSWHRDDNCGVYFILEKEPKEMSHVDTNPLPSVIPGVSLRDYFAGCAITGFLARYHKQPGAVSLAYEVADAMLEEREKSLNGGDNAATN